MVDQIAIPPAAQVVYTTSFFTSPQFIAAVVAAILFGLQRLGINLSDDVTAQLMLSTAVGWALGAAGNWIWPSASGRLGLTAPAAYNVPATISIPVGTASVVTVPAARDEAQVATVTPIEVGVQPVNVAAARDASLYFDSPAAPMTVTVGEAK